MSAAVAGTTPEPEIPATKPLGHHRRGPQNGLQSLDSIPVTRKFRPTASYTNPRDVTPAGGLRISQSPIAGPAGGVPTRRDA